MVLIVVVLCGVECWLRFQKLLDDIDWGGLIGVVDRVVGFWNIFVFFGLRSSCCICISFCSFGAGGANSWLRLKSSSSDMFSSKGFGRCLVCCNLFIYFTKNL